VSKKGLETEFGETLNEEIYLKSDRGTQLVNPGDFYLCGKVGEAGS
jgi:hypothetical protein